MANGRMGERANGRADGERFHVKLACRDTNDLKALNRSEQAAGCTYQHRVLSTHLELVRARACACA